MKTMPTALARLCNRLACERMKAQTWVLGQQIRAEYEQRLNAGESREALEAELHRQTVAAVSQQWKASNNSGLRPAKRADWRSPSQSPEQ